VHSERFTRLREALGIPNGPARSNLCAVALKKRWRSLPELNLKQRRKPAFSNDKRRKHRHWQVTVVYRDGEKFVRVYADRVKATGFAERQKKSPVVKAAHITEVGS
jgi:hypothetical protein